MLRKVEAWISDAIQTEEIFMTTAASQPLPTHLAKYMSVEAAAAYTGLSSSTLNKLRVFGGGPPYVKIGRRVVYQVTALDEWLVSKRRASTSAAA